MVSLRPSSLFLFIATFTLLAFASPIAVDGLSIDHTLVATRSLESRISDENDIINVFTALQDKVDVSVKSLDGVQSPIGPISDIACDVDVSVKALGGTDVKFKVSGSQVQVMVSAFDHMITSVNTGLGKYPVISVLSVGAQMQSAFRNLISTSSALIPDLGAQLIASSPLNLGGMFNLVNPNVTIITPAASASP